MRPVVLAALLLAACSPAPQAQAPPPAAEPVRDFVGPWAARADDCARYPWPFRADGIDTAGEVSCKWDRTERTADGWRLHGVCHSEGNTTAEPVVLVFDGADAMTVSGGFWTDPIRLVRCPTP